MSKRPSRTRRFRCGTAIAAMVFVATVVVLSGATAGAAPKPTVAQVQAKVNQLTSQFDQVSQQLDQVSEQLSAARTRLSQVHSLATFRARSRSSPIDNEWGRGAKTPAPVSAVALNGLVALGTSGSGVG